MTSSNDLIDRVAAANPVPTDASLSPDERREADALLSRVLSTPVKPTDAPRPRRRRAALALAGVAACALLAVAVTGMLNGAPGIAGRAYAAVSEPSLYHVVRSTTFDVPVGLRSTDLGLPGNDVEMESWYDLKRPAAHELHYELRDGRRSSVIFEGAGGPDKTTIRGFGGDQETHSVQDLETGGPPEIARFDPTAAFKAAYREGKIREEGMVTVAGRRAHRLVIEQAGQPPPYSEFSVRSSRSTMLFDAQTLYPIESIDESVIEADGRRGSVVMRTRYTTFETLPRTRENLAKLQMSKRR